MPMGDRIRAARLKKGLTQKELAEICNLNRNSIFMYEKNGIEPKYAQLQRIADALDVTINYLLDIIVIPDELANAKIAFYDDDFEGLTQDDIDRLASYARFLRAEREKGLLPSPPNEPLPEQPPNIQPPNEQPPNEQPPY